MVSLAKIKQIIELVKENNLGEIHVQYDEKTAVTIKNRPPSSVVSTQSSNTAQATAVTPNIESLHAEKTTPVLAPMVGTLYLTPSPDQPPFVREGTRVKKGDTLFIIEAMKLFNKITAEHSGTVTKILCESGDTIEFDQPILLIQED
jgi:acetyl-CoA carboxylase biotin carboxyl carrier protein